MQIRTTRKGLEAFECKFEPLERYWKHSNANLKHSNVNSNHSKGIRRIPIQICSIRNEVEAFERDSKHSKEIRSIRMQIRTIRKELEAIECKLEAFESDSKNSNENSNHSNHSKGFELNGNSKDSKGIRIIRMQIRTTQKGLEAFEFKFEAFKRDSKYSKVFRSIHKRFEAFERDSKNSKEIQSIRKGFEAFGKDSKYWNVIQSIRILIRTIRKGLEAIEWKFE